MLWYNNPESVDIIRRARLEDRTTVRTPNLRVVRTASDTIETAF